MNPISDIGWINHPSVCKRKFEVRENPTLNKAYPSRSARILPDTSGDELSERCVERFVQQKTRSKSKMFNYSLLIIFPSSNLINISSANLQLFLFLIY